MVPGKLCLWPRRSGSGLEWIDFVNRRKSVAASWDPQKAASDFDNLCDEWRNRYRAFMDALKRKRPYYLAFLDFPFSVRSHFSTTNIVETVNLQIERIRINNGG